MSRARRARRARQWRRYLRRYDALLLSAPSRQIQHPHRITAGYFRVVEGWRPAAAVYIARGHGYRGMIL